VTDGRSNGRTDGRSELGGADRWDAIVVGGGPAGLAAAVNLGRSCRSVLLFDCPETGRSEYAQVNHNYLGFPDGIRAQELREQGRLQAERYGARFHPGDAVSVRRTADGFLVADADGGGHVGRGIILATGVKDRWPRFPGYEAFVGRSLHWCLICDGYEMQGKRVVVVGNDAHAAETSIQLLRFTRDVTLLTNDGALGLPPETADRLARRGVALVVDRITGARSAAPGMLEALELERGDPLPAEHLFSLQGAEPKTALAHALGLELTADGYVKVDTEGRTSEPGVYAAGDVTRLFSHQIATAGHEGATAAFALNYDLYLADEAHEQAIYSVAAVGNEAEMESRP
jgi:thioredoxin reductase (NADPH)